jgi:carboxymethylenebutenolidase
MWRIPNSEEVPVGPIKQYLAEEVAVDHADGLISRREALRRLGMLGFGAVAAGSLLAACATDDDGGATATPGTATDSPAGEAVSTEDITFDGPRGDLMGAWAAADDPQGGLLVIHENRGLTDHIKNVAGRFGASGYSALALDLLSEEGGTASLDDEAAAMAALSEASDQEGRFVADMKAGLDEIVRRLPDAEYAAVGFCFGGGMVWQLLASGEPRLAAAAPFYGPAPKNPDFSGSENAAVLGIYAEQDERVNNGGEMAASRTEVEAALENAGLTHEIFVAPGAGHAFFNDTGDRYNAEQAGRAYDRVLEWFGEHLS